MILGGEFNQPGVEGLVVGAQQRHEVFRPLVPGGAAVDQVGQIQGGGAVPNQLEVYKTYLQNITLNTPKLWRMSNMNVRHGKMLIQK